MTDIRSLERTLLVNLPWNKARIKFVARFLLALYAMRTVNRGSGRNFDFCYCKMKANLLHRFARV
jgi:hypothetical protein